MNEPSTLQFTKMHGAGNDFVLFDNRTAHLSPAQLKVLAPAISDRKFGIGSDGLIALEYDETEQADLVMVYKNPDGSDAGMCGNGARCFARYAVTLGSPENFTFRVHDHIYRAVVNDNGVSIEFPLETEISEVTVDDETFLDVYTNTEHIVCAVDQKMLGKETKLVKKGRYLRNHPTFRPAGTNVNFIRGQNGDSLQLQTYERGVENLTLACGTGAIASALAWHHLQSLGEGEFSFKINVKGGTLTVHFSFNKETQKYSTIKLEGPASFVFEGQYYI